MPQTVIITEGRVRTRFVASGAYATLLEALRSTTGVQETDNADRSTNDAGLVFTERDGRYETHKDGRVVLTLPVNRGRWTRWPDADSVAHLSPCGFEGSSDIHVAPDESRQLQRVLWRTPTDGFVYELLERWRDSNNGEKRPVGPHFRNHLPALEAMLVKQQRVIDNALT